MLRTTITAADSPRGARLNSATYLGASLFALMAMSPAAAQQVAASPPADDTQSRNTQGQDAQGQDTQGQAVEDIIVTANRRLESAQKTPLSVTAFDGSTLEQQGTADIQSIALAVPGVQFNRQAGSATPFVRGIGAPSAQAGREPEVAVYIDDVYIASGQGSLANIKDISRVEVLKGPQGTLFGRNATGGVVQVFTKNPTPEFALDASVGYANYDTISGSAYATGAITDTLSANISVYGSKQNDGWGRNVTTGEPSYRSRSYGVRGKLLFTPTARTTALLTLNRDVTHDEEGVSVIVEPGTRNATGSTAPDRFFDLNSNVNPYVSVKQSSASLKITQDLTWASLVSITAYRHVRGVSIFDQDAGPVPLVDLAFYNPETTFTQEVQLLSPTGSAFSWIIGGYYFNDTSKFDPLVTSGAAFPYAEQNGFSSARTKSYSAFAQATVTVLPDTHLTAGARYTTDKRKLTVGLITQPKGGTFGPLVPAANSPQSRSWSEPTFRAVLDHQFTKDILAYVGYNRGFKSGLYNISPSPVIGEPVSPETVDAYTAGFKSEFFDQKLRFNAEGFYYSIGNLQVTQIVPGGSIISNAAAARIKGVDVDIAAVPVRNLTLTAGFEFLDGEYRSFPNGSFFAYRPVPGGNCTFTVVPGGPPPCAVLPPNYNATTGGWDLKGNDTVQSPPFSLNMSTDYKIPTSVGAFELNALWSHTASFFWDADNGLGQLSPGLDKRPKLDLVNASIGWTSNTGKLEARLWANNLTNERYNSYLTETAVVNYLSRAAPRTYGITLMAHFGG